MLDWRVQTALFMPLEESKIYSGERELNGFSEGAIPATGGEHPVKVSLLCQRGWAKKFPTR